MSNKEFNVYLNFDDRNLSVSVFEEFNDKSFFFKKYSLINNFKKESLSIINTEKIVEKCILEIEKTTGLFLKDIYLMLENPKSISINLSLVRNYEGEIIKKKDIQYLIQDAKQQILISHQDLSIAHIIVDYYIIDNKSYNNFPSEISCHNFSINIKFICFRKKIIERLEEIFNNQEINITKIICGNYAKSFNDKEMQLNICESGARVVQGINKQEVVIIPKKQTKEGFFERLFHLFK